MREPNTPSQDMPRKLGNPERQRWALEKMKRVSTGVGVAVGIAIGIVFLFKPVEVLPSLLTNITSGIAGALRRILMPNEDPMGAFLIEIPVLVLIFALIGGIAGLMIGVLWTRIRRRKQMEEAQQPNACD